VRGKRGGTGHARHAGKGARRAASRRPQVGRASLQKRANPWAGRGRTRGWPNPTCRTQPQRPVGLPKAFLNPQNQTPAGTTSSPLPSSPTSSSRASSFASSPRGGGGRGEGRGRPGVATQQGRGRPESRCQRRLWPSQNTPSITHPSPALLPLSTLPSSNPCLIPPALPVSGARRCPSAATRRIGGTIRRPPSSVCSATATSTSQARRRGARHFRGRRGERGGFSAILRPCGWPGARKALLSRSGDARARDGSLASCDRRNAVLRFCYAL
jgi:hypothetical protein